MPGDAEAAKNYWKERAVPECYTEKVKQVDAILQVLKPLCENEVSSVFEFGCGTGRTLHWIQRTYPSVSAFGMDVSPIMVQKGLQSFPVNIQLGDEKRLKRIPDDHFDLVFTCSVLDHIPEPFPPFSDLARIARRYLLLLEPMLVHNPDGKVFEGRVDDKLTYVSYTYSWNYDAMIARSELDILSREHLCLAPSGMGPYYYLWLCRKPGKSY